MRSWAQEEGEPTLPVGEILSEASPNISVVVRKTKNDDEESSTSPDSRLAPPITARQRRWQNQTGEPQLHSRKQRPKQTKQVANIGVNCNSSIAQLLKAKSYGCVKPNIRAIQILNKRRPATTHKVSCFFNEALSPARPYTSTPSERAKKAEENHVSLSSRFSKDKAMQSAPAALHSPPLGGTQPAANIVRLKFQLEQQRKQNGIQRPHLNFSSPSYPSPVQQVSPVRKEPLRASILRAARSGNPVPPLLVAKYDRGPDPTEFSRYVEHRNVVKSFHDSPIGQKSMMLKRTFRNTLNSLKNYHLSPHQTDVIPNRTLQVNRISPMHIQDKEQQRKLKLRTLRRERNHREKILKVTAENGRAQQQRRVRIIEPKF